MNTLILTATLLLTQSLTIDLVEYEVETFSMNKHQIWQFDAMKISQDKKNLIYSIDARACIIQMGSYDHIKENLYYDWVDINNIGTNIMFKINKAKQKCFMFVKKRMLRRQAKKNKRIGVKSKAHTIMAILFGVDIRTQQSSKRKLYHQPTRQRVRPRKNLRRRYKNKRKRPNARRIKRVYY